MRLLKPLSAFVFVVVTGAATAYAAAPQWFQTRTPAEAEADEHLQKVIGFRLAHIRAQMEAPLTAQR